VLGVEVVRRGTPAICTHASASSQRTCGCRPGSPLLQRPQHRQAVDQGTVLGRGSEWIALVKWFKHARDGRGDGYMGNVGLGVSSMKATSVLMAAAVVLASHAAKAEQFSAELTDADQQSMSSIRQRAIKAYLKINASLRDRRA